MFSLKRKINKTQLVSCLVILTTILLGIIAFGQEAHQGSHEATHEGGIPRIVMWQAINFFGLLIILYVLLKKKVIAYFAKRHDTLTSAIREAKKIREEAEQRHQEYTIKIQALQRDAEKLLEQIRKEGELTRDRIVREAQAMAQNIEKEAKLSASTEIERAKGQLHDEVTEQVLAGARLLLSKSIAENDQKRLQQEFVDKIEAVQ